MRQPDNYWFDFGNTSRKTFMENHYKVRGKARLPGVYLWGTMEGRDGWN